MENKYIQYGIIIAVCLIVAVILSRLVRLALNRFINKSSALLNVEATKFSLIKNTLTFIIFLGAFIIIFYSIPEFRAFGLSLFAGAGIFAAIVGFASQQAFSNIISGIFIVIFKPFRVGDNVKIGDLYHGIIEDITLRHTVIRNFESRRVIIPNSVISAETITNSTIIDEKVIVFLEMGISYDSDINKAMSIMEEEAMKHPGFIDNRTDEEKQQGVPPVTIRLLNFTDSSVNLRAWVWSANSASGFVLKCDLQKTIKERFDREGIEIPFPYRTVVFKSKPPKSILQDETD